MLDCIFLPLGKKMISADNDRMVMILMKWTGYSNIVHQNYKKHEYAVYCLANDLYAKGGGMKDILLAHLYPVPEERDYHMIAQRAGCNAVGYTSTER